LPKCSICGEREAIYFRAYSGEYLCRRCFIDSIRRKVLMAISTYKMFEPDDRIGVALSGGKDSLVLLHILNEIEERFPNSEVVAISIDEGIKDYRDEALRIARDACKNLGVTHKVLSFKELYGYTLDEIVQRLRASGEGLTPCAYCGVLRRKALNLAARETAVDKLALAHNLDDEAQTAILNLIHGDIFRLVRVAPSIKVRHPKFVQRVKPLCLVPERETTLWAYLNRIEFQSNPCPYAGEALRNDVRRALNRWEVKHPGIKYTVFHSSQKLVKLLEASLETVELKECEVCGEPTSGKVCKACRLLQRLKE